MRASPTILALTATLAVASLSRCAPPPDRTINPAGSELIAALNHHEALAAAHQAAIAAPGEPGERLVIFGRLVRLEDGAPIGGETIRLYHADTEGEYDSAVPGNESTARLNATLTTDAEGRFLVSTILPGDFGGTPDTRHIHTFVNGAEPEAYDFLFEQYASAELAGWARTNPQVTLLELYRLDDGRLVAQAELAVRNHRVTD